MFDQQINPSIDRSVWGTPECPETCGFHIKQLSMQRRGEGGQSGAFRIMEPHMGLLHDFSRKGTTNFCQTDKTPVVEQGSWSIQVQLCELLSWLEVLRAAQMAAASLKGPVLPRVTAHERCSPGLQNNLQTQWLLRVSNYITSGRALLIL